MTKKQEKIILKSNIENEKAKNKYFDYLKERGIGTRPFYPPIHSQPPYGINGAFPVSDYMSAQGLWLPSSSFLSDEDILRVCGEIRVFYNSSKDIMSAR